MFSWLRVPSIEDGLLDDYGGYGLRYRSSLHPVALFSSIDAHLHVWHCTLQLNDPSVNDLSAV